MRMMPLAIKVKGYGTWDSDRSSPLVCRNSNIGSDSVFIIRHDVEDDPDAAVAIQLIPHLVVGFLIGA